MVQVFLSLHPMNGCLPHTLSSMDKYQHLKKLSELRDKDILSGKQFETQKWLLLEEVEEPEKPEEDLGYTPSARVIGGLAVGVINVILALSGVAFFEPDIQVTLISLGLFGSGFCVSSLYAKEPHTSLALVALIINLIGLILLLPS